MTPKVGDIWELAINAKPIYLMLLRQAEFDAMDFSMDNHPYDVLDLMDGAQYTEVIQPSAPFWRKLA